ncbi:MAG: SDR family NAD(P)-dependent oxidoreductase [Caulobacterales bacterium]|nr:SDR family NAD(P)-dependent oxidoreductase [Caulobacterales bacterium]
MGIVFVGHGYVARWTAQRVPLATLAATTRDSARAASLREAGRPGLVFDGRVAGAALQEALARASHVLVSAPPDDEGCPAFRALEAALRGARHLAWAGYLSTTGVYGDRAGGWCFEWEAASPGSARARRRVAAERRWLGSGLPAHVFRLPGIYGPERSALDRVRSGTARRIVKPGLVFNRIHVADIAAALALSMQKPEPGLVVNLADDKPAPPQDVTVEACRLLGRRPPPETPFESAGLTGMAAEFFAESKRCSNARAKARLGWRPSYRSYREGLAACRQAEAGGDS